MVAAYIALIISLICVVFLIVILFKVKNKFETKNILEKSQLYMERMVADMNKNAMRDIDLVNQNSKQLRELILQAENTINSFNEATDRLRAMISEAEKAGAGDIDNKIRQQLQPERPIRYAENKNVAPLKTISQRNKEMLANSYVQNEKTVLESKPKEEKTLVYTKTVNTKPATNNYIDVSRSKRSLSDKVNELFAKGYPVEEIARQLTCSVTEVQTIIDLGI